MEQMKWISEGIFMFVCLFFLTNSVPSFRMLICFFFSTNYFSSGEDQAAVTEQRIKRGDLQWGCGLCEVGISCSLVPTSPRLSLPSCCVNNRFLRSLAAKSCGRRDPLPSWRVPAAGPSSSLPCSASRRSCTLSASASTSWTTRRSASCLRELASQF